MPTTARTLVDAKLREPCLGDIDVAGNTLALTQSRQGQTSLDWMLDTHYGQPVNTHRNLDDHTRFDPPTRASDACGDVTSMSGVQIRL